MLRALWDRLRFENSRQAIRRSALFAAVMAPLLQGVTRSYRVAAPAEIIPADEYTKYDGLLQLVTVRPFLIASDGFGRARLAVAGWLPEPAAIWLIVLVCVVFYALTIDYSWALFREVHEDLEKEDDETEENPT